MFSASDELLVIPPKSAVTVKVAFQPRHLSEGKTQGEDNLNVSLDVTSKTLVIMG